MGKICVVSSPDLSAEAETVLADALRSLTNLGCEVLRKTDDDLGAARERTRIHDLKEALMTMEHAMRDLDRGYQFDDEFADEKKKIIAKAIATLDREGKAWLGVIRQA